MLIEGKPVTIRSTMDAIRRNLGFVTEDRKETGLVLCRDIMDNSNYVFWQKTPGMFKGRKASAGQHPQHDRAAGDPLQPARRRE